MSTQQKSSSKLSSQLDTSHLKVKFPFKAKYGNYINGKFVEPKSGKYFDNTTPITNEVICSVPRSNEKDVESALDAAHKAFVEWGKTDITFGISTSKLPRNIYYIVCIMKIEKF